MTAEGKGSSVRWELVLQGLEKPVIILSTAVTRPGSFVGDAQRLNVALTRAKHHLILVTAPSHDTDFKSSANSQERIGEGDKFLCYAPASPVSRAIVRTVLIWRKSVFICGMSLHAIPGVYPQHAPCISGHARS